MAPHARWGVRLASLLTLLAVILATGCAYLPGQAVAPVALEEPAALIEEGLPEVTPATLVGEPVADSIDDRRPPHGWGHGPSTSISAELRQRMADSLAALKGTLLERSFHSVALGKDMPYVVYLPPGYSEGVGGYPVLYLLHGRGGERGEWITSGVVSAADKAILAGQITPMIIVSPEGQLGYWTNHTAGGPRWGDYVAKDLVSHIDSTFATVARPGARAIGGISMGGWGALSLTFSHPDVFGIVGAHSPALRGDDGSLAFLGHGQEFESKNPLTLAKSVTSTWGLKIWIDTGKDDPWASRAATIDGILTSDGVSHAWHANPGGHSWTYWRAHLDDYLTFYSRAFTNAPAQAVN